MSGSAAISRAKARRGMSGNETSMSQSAAETFGKMSEVPQHPDKLLLTHDYKLFVFERKIRQLYEMIHGQYNNKNELSDTINENMLSEALSSLDNRLENLESGSNTGDFSKHIEKLEQEQKELKSLLLKVQNMTMETNLKVMQLKDNKASTEVKKPNNILENTQDLTSEVLDLSLNDDQSIGKKKGKK